ncbi:MAG: pantoate--beta-alanine ligase [Tannerella sp.]|jgi:pantoate--beta-alanine ligase|nr:pantoate--beta-alanine ligase [Tannerella sp.]
MTTVQYIKDLEASLDRERLGGKSVGLVPTMGALHDGHLSLIRRCKQENDVCVASIFVNPTQFNDPADLAAYPRNLPADLAMLRDAGCDYAFTPPVEEIYPSEDTRVFDLGAVATVMEGAHRKGHFNGVAQVVSKLFDIVYPDRAYFGEKDYQQIAVIREMTRLLGLPVEIVPCPIVREPDGLALSSRNARLSPLERAAAPAIADTLNKSVPMAGQISTAALKDYVTTTLNAIPPLRVEYFEIADRLSLQPLRDWPQDLSQAMGFIAVYCGDVRLIDNIKY